MRAKIADIPDGVYEGEPRRSTATAWSTSRSRIKMKITKKGEDLLFDMTGSSPPCRGPMNSVIATTKSAIYLAIKHIFPDVPINAGTFEPLQDRRARGHLPLRPVSAAGLGLRRRGEPAHRRGGVRRARPRRSPTCCSRRRPAPRATSASAATIPSASSSYVMYLFTGGGYGGFQGGDGLSQRLLDHRHLQDAAGRGAGAVLSRAVRGVLAARGLGRRRRVPRRLRHQLRDPPAPRRGARLDGDGSRPHRPAGRAGRRGRRRQHGRGRARAARSTGRRIFPRTRTSRSASATWCACRRRAAAASAIRPGASPRRSPATSRAATTARPRRARSSDARQAAE